LDASNIVAQKEISFIAKNIQGKSKKIGYMGDQNNGYIKATLYQ
jgi:hypothetical protein